ncbi:uncharacterized protein LOC144006574 [Festucalex cinctus]
MYSEQSRTPREAGARPRRETQPPIWMQDYVSSVSAQQQSADDTYEHQPSYSSVERSMERAARMTSLIPPQTNEDWNTLRGATAKRSGEYEHLPPLSTSTPVNHGPRPAVGESSQILAVLHSVLEDNQRIQNQMMEMQRRLNTRIMPSASSPTTQPRPPPVPSQVPALPTNQDHGQLPPFPAQADIVMLPLNVEEEWPLPPPPVADDLVERRQRPLPPTGMVADLTDRLNNMRTTPPQLSFHPEQRPLPAGVQTPVYSNPYTPPRCGSEPRKHPPTTQLERVYRGPKPTIPSFTKGDPREFARLKVALENLLPEDATERFKYHILVDHLEYEDALLIADSYTNSIQPYTDTMNTLTEQYGQPHQLALRKIADLMESSNIGRGDTTGFKRFALRVRALVGLLEQLGESGQTELCCGSHVTRLLSKLPHDMRAEFKRFLYPMHVTIPSLLHFSDWLDYELKIQEIVYESSHSEVKSSSESKSSRRHNSKGKKNTSILHTMEKPSDKLPTEPSSSKKLEKTPFCPYCVNTLHYLDQCANFALLTGEQKTTWIKSNRKCWRCGRSHQAAQCRLKVTCPTCKRKHLQALHEVNIKPADESPSSHVSSTNEVLYLDRRSGCHQVLLKISRVLLRNGEHSLETYAVLDDGSERTIILSAAAQSLKLIGQPEQLALRTVRQDIRVIHGAAVSFTISPVDQPHRSFRIQDAFTADALSLAEHTYSAESLQRKYRHLRDLPIPTMDKVRPLLLIGSDYPHLITPLAPVRLGRPGGPAAVKTRLGWTLQGPIKHIEQKSAAPQCLHISTLSPTAEILHNVEKLWQLDVLPYRSEKLVVRSRQDQDAIHLLETKTTRVDIQGTQRYATPLLRVKNMPQLNAPKEAVLANLRSTEKRLLRDPDRATAYCAEIDKLEKAGYVLKGTEEELRQAKETWFIPHHMVSHNGKNRIVFNCSFCYKGDNLNKLLLPGPTLTSSLLGVLVRFREYSVAVSSDIKGMFHQVRLLPEDKTLLCFLWRGLKTDQQPSVYIWQVLPFGTTCSPCCATFALQKHVCDHSQPSEDVRETIEKSFYVDNCLQSVPTVQEAQHLVNKLTALLAAGGFELRQWASNVPETIKHLPREVRSESSELWLQESNIDPQELTLGLRWLCNSDSLRYKYQKLDPPTPTMRNIYSVLARLYDPLGFIVPFTTRAKVLVQRLWDKQREWDDPSIPEEVLQPWSEWEEELHHLSQVTLPRCYTSPAIDTPNCSREVHVFADASEKAYGSVAYLRTEDTRGQVEVAFLTDRSRVAPKKQQSIPRLELCAALTAAQLAALLQRELTLTINSITLWTDSTTVLTWLQSDSCRFKVFVGTRVAEIQELMDPKAWRYVNSALNPADDITQGRTLLELSTNSRWRHGPAFLQQTSDFWPTQPVRQEPENDVEIRKPAISCLATTTAKTPLQLQVDHSPSYSELIAAVARSRHGAAADNVTLSAIDYQEAEREILQQAQKDSFPEEYNLLKANKPVPSTSRLLTLAPEFDTATGLIRVGGRLRRSRQLEPDFIHPVVLDPLHKVTQLIIQDMDKALHHPGSERLLAELRRKYWIPRGREAVKRHQHACLDCQRWRATPTVPKMADLPEVRLRLLKPPFFSTGMDCFGPFTVKVGRRLEKRWGIIFKCLTTRAVHLDVLSSLDSDSFLMALRRFIARRGKPAELLSDQGTNFKGGERELREAFNALHPSLHDHLAKSQIQFKFNPPNAPHFGGVWEREVRSVKAALYVTIQAQSVPEEVLRTVLTEVEGILNSKPLGYVSTDVADPDPVTPNLLLMGRLDSSLPQAVYADAEPLSRRRWRHSQVLADQFWSHFIKHYLPTLQTRSKWHKDPTQLQIGTTVMVMDPQLPRAMWPIGRVTNVLPGQDKRIRTAEVQVQGKTYVRPVARLIALPSIPDIDTGRPS